MVLVGGAAAGAAAPTYEPDPQAVGTLALYDASGNQVTSGNINNPIAVYAVGSATVRSGDVKAVIFGASPNPDATSTHSRDWSVEQWTAFTPYPLSSGPANVQTLSQTHPVATIGSGDETLGTFISDFPNTPAADSQTAFQNLYQIRLETANAAGTFQTGVYDEMDVLVSGTTWTQVFPTVATTTSTVLTSSANPTVTGTNVTLTATETAADNSHPAGSVQFVDGTTNIGSPVPVNGSGVATASTSFSTTGGHALHAVFTPTDTSSFSGSTGDLTETVNPPATVTTTTLGVVQDGTAGHDVTLTATVAPSAAAGTVAFFDNGSSTAIPGTVSASGGTYTLDLPSGLAAGGHSIVAKFSPTDVTQFEASQSAPQSFVLQPPAVGACAQPGAQCTDTQNIQVTVPVGTLVISTPYTASSPLDLGTMSLTNNASLLTANAPFQNIVVTDTRSGDLPYTVSALASPLTTTNPTQGAGSVNVINGENVGLTGLTATGDASYTGSLTGTHSNAAASPAVQPGDGGTVGLGGTTSHDVFDSDHGLGTVTMNGTLTINAPVNTVPGLYTGTITFTVGG